MVIRVERGIDGRVTAGWATTLARYAFIMPSPVNLLDSLRAKLARASAGIQELDMAISAFHATNPYKVAFSDDHRTNHRTFYANFTEDVPFEVGAIAGNILHDLRSFLDHLAYHRV